MLPSQRDKFDIPRDVCFLNAAAWSPLPKASVEAGRIGVARKSQPWRLDRAFADQQYERARSAAARLINADANDIALISSVGYGVSTAAKILDVPRGSRVLVLENDHTSPMLDWMQRSETGAFAVDVVRQPADGDWTTAVLDAIAQPGAPPVSIASISSLHWSDGGLIDLARIMSALKGIGARSVIDATHAVGVIPYDIVALDPDFLIFPTYKWLVGPYGRAFLYVAKRNQDGTPLEQTSYGRRRVVAEDRTYFTDTRYVETARRFDMGERDHFVSLEMASIGMELIAELGPERIAARLQHLTDRLASGLEGITDVRPTPREHRAPHILCLGFEDGMPEDLVTRLADEQVHVAPRLGRMRISPHVYNDEADIDRFIEVFGSAIRKRA